MRNLFLILLVALIGAGVYGYINNPAACRKLGSDILANATTIFTPGSGKAPPAPVASAAPADTAPKHWQQGFVTEQLSHPPVPAPVVNPPALAPAESPSTAASVPAAIIPSSPPPAAAPSRPFTKFTNYTMALNEARAENKPLLILFSGMDWSAPSQTLEAQVISQAAFKRFSAAHFVFLDLDSPQTLANDDGALNTSDDSNALTMPRDDSDLAALKAPMNKYNVHTVPTIIVINTDELQIGRIDGGPTGPGAGPEELIAKLQAILRQ